MGNCWQCFREVIRFCDIFGILLTFRMNNKVKYRSIDGGVASIIFFIYSIFYIIYLGVPFIQRKNIDFIYSNKIIETQPFINLTEANFTFAFGIQFQSNFSSALTQSAKYFEYSVNIMEIISKTTERKYPLNLRKCVPSDFKEVYNTSFYMNDLDDLLCPNLDKSINFTLDGFLTDQYFKFITLEIKLTEYGMNNLNEVRNFMQNNPIEMGVFFLDTAIDYKNRTNPLPSYINYISKGLDLYFLKTTEIFFSIIEFSNDENIITSNEKTTIGKIFDKSEDSFHYITSREDINEFSVGKFILKSSAKIITLSRKYQKLPSFVGQLSGVIEQAYLVLFLLVTFIERQAIENKLIHRMLKMKGSKFYDMDYYLTVFHRETIHNNIIDLIKKGNFQIEKTNKGGLGSKRKSQMLLLYKNRMKSMLDDEKSQKETKDNNLNNKEIKTENHEKDKESERNNNQQMTKKESLSIIEEEPLEKDSNRINNIQLTNTGLNNNDNEKIDFNDDVNDEYEKIEKEKEKEKELEKEKEKETKSFEKAEADFPSTSVLSIFFTYLTHCTCNYQKRKYQLIKKAKGKINYYLEIINYVKGMQEIDLFKYCLFDKEQIYILDYLAKPPFRLSHKEIDCIYSEFEKDQYTFEVIGKDEIDKVYNSYNTIRNKGDVTFEDLKLLRLINAEVDYLS